MMVVIAADVHITVAVNYRVKRIQPAMLRRVQGVFIVSIKLFCQFYRGEFFRLMAYRLHENMIGSDLVTKLIDADEMIFAAQCFTDGKLHADFQIRSGCIPRLL
jgi:hypothetical protein